MLRDNAGRLYIAANSAAISGDVVDGDAIVFSWSFCRLISIDDDDAIALIFPLIKFLCVRMSCEA